MVGFFLVSLALLVLFLILTDVEAKRGFRVLAPLRVRLDTAVSRVEFVVTHVDLGAFMQETTRAALMRLGHDIAKVILSAVRFAERFLSRIVRKIRMQQEMELVKTETDRPFVKALSDFKGQLREQQTTVPDIVGKE